MTTSNTEPMSKEVEVLMKQWELYISQPVFFSNLIGATLIALISFPIVKDNPQLIKSSGMITGLLLLVIAFIISIVWRWASQWAMEVEVLGKCDKIDSFFDRANRERVITGAKQGGIQAMLEDKFIKRLRSFMKIAALLILILYLLGGGFVVASIGSTDMQNTHIIQKQ